MTDAQKIQSLITALGLALDRLEGASPERPPSEDREHLLHEDQTAINIGRKLIDRFHAE